MYMTIDCDFVRFDIDPCPILLRGQTIYPIHAFYLDINIQCAPKSIPYVFLPFLIAIARAFEVK